MRYRVGRNIVIMRNRSCWLFPNLFSLLVCYALLLSQACDVAHALPQFVHQSQGDRVHAGNSWIQINGQRVVKTSSLGFLLRTDSDTYVSPFYLPDELIEQIAKDYILKAPAELEVEIVRVEAGYANIMLGDLGSSNWGVGVEATVKVRVPEDLAEGTRRITIEFPAALVVRDTVGAEAPTHVPSIVFRVSNYRTEKSRAAARWWRYMIYGILFLIAAVIAPAFGEGGGVASVGLVIGALYFVGRAVGDWTLLNEHAFIITAACFGVPIVVALLLFPDAWPVGPVAAALLGLLILLCSWRDWDRLETGAFIFLPGLIIGGASAGLRYWLQTRDDVED